MSTCMLGDFASGALAVVPVRELLAAHMEHVVAGGAQLGARPMQHEIHRLALRVLERRDGLATAEGLEADETELALRRKPSATA